MLACLHDKFRDFIKTLNLLCAHTEMFGFFDIIKTQ